MLSHKYLESVATLNYYYLRFVNGTPPPLHVSMSTQTDGNANVVFSRLFVALLRAHLVRLRPHSPVSTWGVWDIAKTGDTRFSRISSLAGSHSFTDMFLE